MEKKNIGMISLFAGAIVLLLVGIMYMASAGTAKFVTGTINDSVEALVESNNDGSGNGIALLISTIGAGVSAVAIFILRLLGGIHFCGALLTGVMGLTVRYAISKEKNGLYKGFTIWAMVRHILYCVFHIVLMVIMGVNIRSLVATAGLIISVVITIWALATDKKKKAKKEIYNSAEPVIHM